MTAGDLPVRLVNLLVREVQIHRTYANDAGSPVERSDAGHQNPIRRLGHGHVAQTGRVNQASYRPQALRYGMLPVQLSFFFGHAPSLRQQPYWRANSQPSNRAGPIRPRRRQDSCNGTGA